MHAINFRSLLILVACWCSLSQALFLPNNEPSSLAIKSRSPASDLVNTLERRLSLGGLLGGKGKGGKGGSSSKKSDPTTTPPPSTPTTTQASPKSTTPKTTSTSISSTSTTSSSVSSTLTSTSSTSSSTLTASTTLSTSSSASASSGTSTSKGTSISSTSSSATPSPTTEPNEEIIAELAVDFCELNPSNCNDLDSGGPGELSLDDLSLDDLSLSKRFQLEKRDRRPFAPWSSGGKKFTFQSLDYPSAGVLFSPPKGTQVLDKYLAPSSDKLTAKVIALAKPLKIDGSKMVTEHIVELQTILAFMKSATTGKLKTGKSSKTKKIPQSYFRSNWIADIPAAKLATMTIFDASATSRDTPNDRVFEAMGSTTNRKDFVLCEKNLNAHKARFWSFQKPLASADFSKYLRSATSGTNDVVILAPTTTDKKTGVKTPGKPKRPPGGTAAEKVITALRNSLAVFQYLNNAEVKSRLQESIKNVGHELAEIEKALPVPAGSGSLLDFWDEFIADYFIKVQTFSQTWMKDNSKAAIDLYEAEIDVLKKNIAKAKTGATKEKLENKEVRLNKELIIIKKLQAEIKEMVMPKAK